MLSGVPMDTTWDTSAWDDEHEWPDLIREAVDGRVGEDPPPRWQRRS
jgi:hypothetical protein